MKKTLFLLVIGFAAGALVVALVLTRMAPREAAPGSDAASAAMHDHADDPMQTKGPEGTTLYTCPMHPAYVSDTPGDCPICDMRLVPVETAPAPEPPKRKVIYRSTMIPGEVSDHPGKDSMGMDMVPVEVEETGATSVAGYTTVNIPAYKQQFIGVKTAKVEKRSVASTIEAVGRVDYDETKLSWINAKVSGWIEALYVNTVAQVIRPGEPLMAVYSPELVATQDEYLVARDNLSRLEAGGARTEALASALGLFEDTRTRLQLLDIPQAQIDALEQRGEVSRRMTLVSPVGGIVVEKTALEGKAVAAGENLFRIADLSTVWILAEVYESQVTRLRPGQKATISISYMPGRTFEGRIDTIYPFLDPVSRTIRVRLVVPNPGLALRPEMYANVRFEIPGGRAELAVPNEAILDTGERRIAFVSHGEGTFEPRELTVGERTREFTVVLDGLSEGEEVVTSGNFLIDSESRLKAALAGMRAGGSGS